MSDPFELADKALGIKQSPAQNKKIEKTVLPLNLQASKQCCPCSKNNQNIFDIFRSQMELITQTHMDLLKKSHLQMLSILKNTQIQIISQTKKELQKICKEKKVEQQKTIPSKLVQNVSQNKQNKQQKNIRSQSEPKSLKIAALNFSGVLTSPFQFHQTENQDQIALNQIFAKMVSQKYPNFMNQKQFKWDMGSIDTKWNNRYTPINFMQLDPPVGVSQEGKILSEQEFLQQWDKTKDETLPQLIKEYFQPKYTKEQRQQKIKLQLQRTKQFDLFCYKAILQKIYGANAIKRSKELETSKYIQARKIYFDKPYLNKKKKIQTTIQGLKKLELDIANFEESSTDLVDKLKQLTNYICIKSNPGNSVILLNKKTFSINESTNFKEKNEEFYKKYKSLSKSPDQNIQQKLAFNKDSAFQVLDDYLFFCIHITSKQQKNSQQFEQVKNLIKQINTNMPNYKIIIAGDFNRIILPKDFQFGQNSLNIFPTDPNIKTVKKKRTLLQPQRHKGLKLDQSAKDYIISNLPINNGKCMMINGKPVEGDLLLLPNVDHPYDHYMIYAQIKVQ